MDNTWTNFREWTRVTKKRNYISHGLNFANAIFEDFASVKFRGNSKTAKLIPREN